MKSNFPKRSVLLVAYTLLLCGCSARTSAATSDETLELLPEPYTISFNINRLSVEGAPVMSDVVESLEYIKLEFNPNYPIARILGRIHIDNERIILHASHGVGLLQYTRDGKFVRRIGSIGRGPGEYASLRGFRVDNEAGIIYTMPNYERAVDRYDLATGRYLGKAELTEANGEPMIGEDHGTMYPLSDGKVVSILSDHIVSPEAQHPPHYIFMDIDLPTARIVHREESKLYPSSSPARVGSVGFWYDDRGRLNVKEELNNTAYVVNPDDTMTPKVTFDLGNTMINAGNYQTIRSAEDAQSRLFVYTIEETRRYFRMNLYQGGNNYSVAYDKSSGKSYILGKMSRTERNERGHFLGFLNDLDGGFALSSLFSSYDEDMWFASFDAYKMMELLTPEHFAAVRSTVKDPAALARLQSFVASLSEEDNPVIVIAHLKN